MLAFKHKFYPNAALLPPLDSIKTPVFSSFPKRQDKLRHNAARLCQYKDEMEGLEPAEHPRTLGVTGKGLNIEQSQRLSIAWLTSRLRQVTWNEVADMQVLRKGCGRNCGRLTRKAVRKGPFPFDGKSVFGWEALINPIQNLSTVRRLHFFNKK